MFSQPDDSLKRDKVYRDLPLDTQPTEEWIAPYHSYFGSSDPSQYGGTYTVYFFPGYTLAAHQESLGSKVEGTYRRSSYEAVLSAEKREQVRRDRGVKQILEGCPAHWRANKNEVALAMLESDQEEASTIQNPGDSMTTPNIVSKETVATQLQSSVLPNQEWIAPYYPYDGSQGPCQRYDMYMADFFEGHTMKKHKDVVGRDIGGLQSSHWYQGVLSEEKRERVRRDPGVSAVQQYGPAVWG